VTLITLPTGFDFDSEDWRIDVPGQLNRSVFTSKRKYVGLPGAEMWMARVTVEAITTEIDERKWRAFTLKMRGQENTFQIIANCQTPPSATALVGVGATDGYSLPLTNMAVSQTILHEGEFMTVPLPSGHKRLVCLTADLVANGSGVGTATFEPALNEVPTFAAALEITNPYALVNLRERSNGWVRQNGIAQFVLDAEEAR
jgi:hypothetical protein